MTPLPDLARRVITQLRANRYLLRDIARETGLNAAVLGRVVRGEALRAESVARLAAMAGYDVRLHVVDGDVLGELVPQTKA